MSRFLTPKHDKFSLVFCSEELVPVVVPDICFSLLSDVGCCLLCITSQGRGRDSGSVEGHMGAITCDQYHHTGPFLVFCCLRALVWGRRDTFSCGKISVVCSPVACFFDFSSRIQKMCFYSQTLALKMHTQKSCFRYQRLDNRFFGCCSRRRGFPALGKFTVNSARPDNNRVLGFKRGSHKAFFSQRSPGYVQAASLFASLA